MAPPTVRAGPPFIAPGRNRPRLAPGEADDEAVGLNGFHGYVDGSRSVRIVPDRELMRRLPRPGR